MISWRKLPVELEKLRAGADRSFGGAPPLNLFTCTELRSIYILRFSYSLDLHFLLTLREAVRDTPQDGGSSRISPTLSREPIAW